jgi:mono/diheme cytochrome c family protein
MSKYLILVTAMSGWLATVLAQAQAPATVNDGVYTAAQADRGNVAYQRFCIGCHEGQDADGPELAGKVFMDRWREDKLEVLSSFIKTSMPGNVPGSLDDATVADLMAYILHENAFPAGDKELTPALMGTIQLIGPEGPQPLANLTIVRAVGCLTSEAANAWTVGKVSKMSPVRDRIVEGTTPAELKASAAMPLGGLTFPLMSVPAKGASMAGHKVQVKGVLTRQGAVDRINVMSLESVAATCEG